MDKTIVISGANRGIGYELTRQYLEKGAVVYAGTRIPLESKALFDLQNKYSDKLIILPLDVSSETSIKNFNLSIENNLDTIINCAGIFGTKSERGSGMEEFAGEAIDKISKSEWLNVFEVNAIGPFMLTRELRSKLSSHAKIAMISSQMGSMAFNTYGMSYVYNSSKAALNMIGRSLAVDLKNDGASVCMIHPGWVRTDMGGPNAEITVEASAAGIISVIDNLCPETTGKFFNYDGSERNW